MSPRSIYLRDQAAKCRWHAKNISDAETQVGLRKLADEYVEEATEIETNEKGAGALPPTLWLPSQSPRAPDAEAPAE